MNWLALDIGGANLKLADGKGFARLSRFALWKAPEDLVSKLRRLLAEAPPYDQAVVTMTGELADCFSTKAAGVRFIIQAALDAVGGRPTFVYLTNGQVVAAQHAMEQPLLAAASNWHALARFAARYVERETALLIDIGSTTCDVVPLIDGRPANVGKTDTQRLLSGELVYTGVERSPLCALRHAVPYRGRQCPVAQELFATTWDVYLVLGDLPEEPGSKDTADGRPATRSAARDRLARSICADRDAFNEHDAVAVAESVARSQMDKIQRSVEQVIERLPDPLTSVILSGHGEFLGHRIIEAMSMLARVVLLSERLGAEVSRCAPAHALAVLATETEQP